MQQESQDEESQGEARDDVPASAIAGPPLGTNCAPITGANPMPMYIAVVNQDSDTVATSGASVISWYWRGIRTMYNAAPSAANPATAST